MGVLVLNVRIFYFAGVRSFLKKHFENTYAFWCKCLESAFYWLFYIEVYSIIQLNNQFFNLKFQFIFHLNYP